MNDKKRYVLGYDYGTLSCRILAADLQTGESVYSASLDYPHGVISDALEDGTPLPKNFYLQHPGDYWDVMVRLTRGFLRETGIDKNAVLAMGVDFTNCTVVPLGEDEKVLCQREELAGNPHSWVKLWKHHGAQDYAAEMEEYMKGENIPWFAEYGRNVSSEWFFPKVLQVYREAPDLYEQTDLFLEGTDYITYLLTGNLVRSSAILGVNAFYDEERGFPDEVFFRGLAPGMEKTIYHKLRGEVRPVGSPAGTLRKVFAEMLGLGTHTVVAVGHGDSEVAACGLGVAESGSMILVMGTSTCYQFLYEEKKTFDGVCAIVRDGMVPGLYAYESGQPAVGDIFAWYAENGVPEAYRTKAEEKGVSLLTYLGECAERLKPGQSGLVALDWLNGNRSVLMDYHLTGVLAGLTLHTKPEEIYRALMEATAFGARKILESYENAGIAVKKVYGAGGLPQKSPLLMQIYADVLGREIAVPLVENSSAMGCCVCAAAALGAEDGGYGSVSEAISRMIRCESIHYRPIPEHTSVYDRLYQVYGGLHRLMGEETTLLHQLHDIQQDVMS